MLDALIVEPRFRKLETDIQKLAVVLRDMIFVALKDANVENRAVLAYHQSTLEDIIGSVDSYGA